MPTPTVRGRHSCNKVRAKHNHTRGWCCCFELGTDVSTTFELLSSSPQENESRQSCWGIVAHLPEPTLRSKDGKGENWAELLPFERAIRLEVRNHFRCGTKPKRSCTTVARLPTWCPYLQRKHPSKVVGPMVVTQEPGVQLPPAAPAAAPVSLSLPLSVCCSVLFSYWTVLKVDNLDMVVVHTLSLLAPDVWQPTFKAVRIRA